MSPAGFLKQPGNGCMFNQGTSLFPSTMMVAYIISVKNSCVRRKPTIQKVKPLTSKLRHVICSTQDYKDITFNKEIKMKYQDPLTTCRYQIGCNQTHVRFQLETGLQSEVPKGCSQL